MNDFLEFKNVSKRFGTVQAVDNVSFSVSAANLLALAPRLRQDTCCA